MERPIIGILGGMGPKSTAPFLDILISECEKILKPKSDFEYPPILIYALPTPYRIDPSQTKKIVCEGLKKLEKSDTAFIAMACNTIHIYYETLKNCIKIPLLNIVEATLNEIPQNTKKVILLGTETTINSKLYQNALNNLKIEYVENRDIYNSIDVLINKIKKENDLNVLASFYKKITDQIQKLDIDLALNVCTDLNVVINKIQSPFKIIDSSSCLAKECIKKWNTLL